MIRNGGWISLVVAIVAFTLLCIGSAHADNQNSVIYGITSSSLVVYNPNSNTLNSYYITSTLDDFAVTPAYIFITSHIGSDYYISVVSTQNYQVVYTNYIGSSYNNLKNIAASRAGTYAFILSNGDVKRIDWRNNVTTTLSLADTSIRSIEMSPDGSYIEVGAFQKGYGINADTFTLIGSRSTTSTADRIRTSNSYVIAIDTTSTPKRDFYTTPLFGVSGSGSEVKWDKPWATPSGIDNIESSTNYFVCFNDNNAVWYFTSSAGYFNTTSWNNDICTSNDGTLIYLASNISQINVYANNASHTALGYISTPGVILRLQNGYIPTEYTEGTTKVFTLSTLGGVYLLSGVNCTVYDNLGKIKFYGVTDDLGNVAFPMLSDVTYTLWFSDGNNVNYTATITPALDTYQIKIPTELVAGLVSLANQFLGTDDQGKVSYYTNASLNTSTNVGTLTTYYEDTGLHTASVNFSLYKNNSTVGGAPILVSSSTYALANTANMIVNGDCEAGKPTLGGIGADANLVSSLSTDYSHGGSQSLKLTTGTLGTNQRYYRLGDVVMNGFVPGKTYTLKYYGYVPTSQNIINNLVFGNFLDSGLVTSTNHMTANDTWQLITAQFTITGGATYAFMGAYVFQDIAGKSAYIDDLSISSNGAASSFTVNSAAGNGYYILINATQTDGSLKTYYTPIQFPGPTALQGLPNWFYFWFAFGVCFMIGSTATIRYRGILALATVGAAAIFNYWHWWDINPITGGANTILPGVSTQVAMWGIIAVMFLFAILVIVLDREKTGGV